MPTVMELRDFVSLLQEEGGTITLSSQSPIIKTLILSAIVQEFEKRGQQIQYLDLDLQYSSMLASIAESRERDYLAGFLHIFRSRGVDTIDLVISLLDFPEVDRRGLVIVDSIGTMQSLLAQEGGNKIDYVKSNHETAILLTLIEEFARRNSKVLVIANVARPRPRIGVNNQRWDIELAGGRMIKLKSDVIISATESAKDEVTKVQKIVLRVESVDHERAKANSYEGKTFEFSPKPFI
jgi:hypothetical protein